MVTKKTSITWETTIDKLKTVLHVHQSTTITPCVRDKMIRFQSIQSITDHAPLHTTVDLYLVVMMKQEIRF